MLTPTESYYLHNSVIPKTTNSILFNNPPSDQSIILLLCDIW